MIKVRTKFALAWDSYKETEEYKRTVSAMVGSGMKQPFIDNVLHSAFTAGWNKYFLASIVR